MHDLQEPVGDSICYMVRPQIHPPWPQTAKNPHCTVFYLGKRDQFPPEAADWLLRAASAQPVVTATVTGFEAFAANPQRPGDGRPFVANLDSPALHGIHHAIMVAMAQHGLQSVSDFVGDRYKPHMTVGYLADGEEVPDYSQWIGTKIVFEYGHLNMGTGDDQHWGLVYPKTFGQAMEMKSTFKNANGEDSYPIADKHDLKNAIHAFGRCIPSDKERLKAYIKRRARELGAEALIPANWIDEKSLEAKYNDTPMDRSPRTNWVEERGGLPPFVRAVARALMRDHGYTMSRAIATAINKMKSWARGGDNVTAKTRAKAAAAVAQWEAAKGSKSLSGALALDMIFETKGRDNAMEFKSIAAPLTVDDEEAGILTAFVSVTGVVDNVKDVIEPGAYADTLKARTPKGVLHHSWEKAVSKPLEIKELMPGDPDLPKQMSDGTPWPAEAGALRVKILYNLDTEAGRDAFSTAKFYGDTQEWSIGYNVPAGKATKSGGVRHIKSLDLYEYSQVLWGANSLARTVPGPAKKEAERMLVEIKEAFPDLVKSMGQDDDQDNENEPMDDGDEPLKKRRKPRRGEKSLGAMSAVITAYEALGALINDVPEEKDIWDQVSVIDFEDPANRKLLSQKALEFEQDAYSTKSAVSFLTAIRDVIDTETDEAVIEGLKALAVDVSENVIDDSALDDNDDVVIDDDSLFGEEYDDDPVEEVATEAIDGKDLGSVMQELKEFAIELETN